MLEQCQKPGMKSIENEGVKVKTDHCHVGAMPKTRDEKY